MRFVSACLIALALCACSDDTLDLASGGDPSLRAGSFKMLVFSKTAGFRHGSIPAAKRTMQELAAANGFEVTISEDSSQFTDENLAQYEVVMFLLTTLDVLDAEQEAAFERFIRGGGGFVGVHSGADTEHESAFYREVVGEHFLNHPVANQVGTVRIEDPTHPSTAHLPKPWSVGPEEFYAFKSSPRGQVRVLLNIDESSYLQDPNTSCDPRGPTFPSGYTGTMGDHPISWCHDKFAGRAWYTALGHAVALYSDDLFRQHVLGGILTAARRVTADCSINERPADVAEYVAPQLQNCAFIFPIP
jgi:type 1 glutamine amidotransferase